MVFSCRWPSLERWSWNNFKICLSKAITLRLKNTFCHRNEPKQSIKHRMTNHRCQILQSKRSVSWKQNCKCTGVTNCNLQIFSQSDSFRFFSASSSIPIAVAATPTVWLGLSLWHCRELDKPPWSRRRHRLLHSLETLHAERVKRLNFFKNRWEGLQSHLSLTIFLCKLSFCSLQRHFTWGNLLAGCL